LRIEHFLSGLKQKATTPYGYRRMSFTLEELFIEV